MADIILVWHDCNPCITKSLINYLNWIYLTQYSRELPKIVYYDDLRKSSYEKEGLLPLLQNCEALIYSCEYFHDITGSAEELEAIKNKRWYAVSWKRETDNNEKDKGHQLGFSLFKLKDVHFVPNDGLTKLMKDVKNKRSRL